ncbi:MAG: hypothetical protein M1816_004951 [Peltula sp. TS41687]|nr:MAG: hypothetical protein M1816_004951 [Peltula sp. TS41687]
MSRDDVGLSYAERQSVQESIFETYYIQSAAPNNTINLEVPIAPLHRALKSAYSAVSTSLRLTKKDNVPLLALTIIKNTISNPIPAGGFEFTEDASGRPPNPSFGGGGRDLETIVTQNVPVRVLGEARVEGLREPSCPEPDVHIELPSLTQIKAISDRFSKIASGTRNAGIGSITGSIPKLELSANMHGRLRLRVVTDALSISSVWSGLVNPALDPTQIEGGEEGIRNHPSTRMRELGAQDDGGEAGWATVRVDGFCHERALILYVYVRNDEGSDESVLTVLLYELIHCLIIVPSWAHIGTTFRLISVQQTGSADLQSNI